MPLVTFSNREHGFPVVTEYIPWMYYLFPLGVVLIAGTFVSHVLMPLATFSTREHGSSVLIKSVRSLGMLFVVVVVFSCSTDC